MPTIKELNNFVNYVWSFYAPNSDLYPIKGRTMHQVYEAKFEYNQRILKLMDKNTEKVLAFGIK